MRLLELLSGTGSIGRAFRDRGWEVVSVDLDPKFEPTVCCDIMELDETSLGHFDMVWASPVCTEYSQALRKRPRNLEAGDRLVLRALEVIRNLRPQWRALENPQTGTLHARAALLGRLLLQVRVPVPEGHEDLAQPALAALGSHVPQRQPLRRLRGRHPPRGSTAGDDRRPPRMDPRSGRKVCAHSICLWHRPSHTPARRTFTAQINRPLYFYPHRRTVRSQVCLLCFCFSP